MQRSRYIISVVYGILFGLSFLPQIASAGDVIQLNSWEKIPKYHGKSMTVKQGLLSGDAAWTNARLRNGFLVTQASTYTKSGSRVSLPDVRNSAEYNDFYGLNDKLMAPSLWKGTLKKWARETCSASRAYRNRKSPTEPFLPGEKISDRLLAYPYSDLFMLAGPGLVSDRSGNVYTRASAPYEEVFFKRMGQMAPQSMTPRDVMALALNITSGDYGLAVLTVHYVFKATTYLSRNIITALVRQRGNLERLIKNSPNRPSIAKGIQDYRAEYEKGRRLLQQLNSQP